MSILSPAEGMRLNVGERLTVAVAAASNAKLAAIEVSVGGAPAQVRQIEPADYTASISIEFATPPQGRVTLAAVAIDTAGARSDPAIVTLVVGAEQPAPGPTPIGNTQCDLQAEFVSDLSIPDGTQVQPGASFVKSWRLRNTSACDWKPGVRLAHFEDEQMSTHAEGDPLAAIPKGATFDVSLQLTAPTASGVHTSTWRLRDPSGRSFGNRVYLAIKVP